MHRRLIRMRGLGPFYIPKMPSGCSSCISCRFQPLSTTYGQIAHVLLTRSPLGHLEQALLDLVRLACIRHAASVHPEPGSNSPFAHPVQFSKIDFLASRLLRSALVYITILSLFRQAFFLLFFEENDMVPEAGLEPARYRYRRILSPLRLPVSPLGHATLLYINRRTIAIKNVVSVQKKAAQPLIARQIR